MRYWCSCLWLWSCCAFGQSIFTGKVIDAQNTAVAKANITLYLPQSTAILAFAITDKSGKYTIAIPSNADSLVLKVYGLGYAAQQRTVANKSQEINFSVDVQEIALKEVVIKQKPILRIGDTLTYSVNAFKNQSDRAIGDVIRRLPGIEMQPNGTILYQGKPINKYYIEGLDLLSGRYSLANENLPAESVSQVEIIERHQPIRILDSLVFSENAALNIRLKNKITATGTARLGVGAAPLLWDANVSPMFFSKTQQMIASYQANNIGQNAAQQIKILTIEDALNGFEKNESKKSWVGVVPLAPPNFSDTRWLQNNVHLATVNFLKKLPKNYEMRANVNFLNDGQQQTGNTRTVNYTPTDTVLFEEQKRNRLFFSALDATITVEKNTPTKYFTNQTLLKGQWDSQMGALLLNNQPVDQRQRSPFYLFSNHLKDIFKIKRQLLTFQSFMSLQSTPQSLVVTPGPFVGVFNGGRTFDALEQQVALRGFFTHQMVSLNKELGRGFSIMPQVGFQTEHQRLQSQIGRNLTKERVGGEFENNLSWQKIHSYVKWQTQYQNQKWRVMLQTPVHFYDFKVQDASLQREENLQQLTFEPRLEVSYEFNPVLKLSGGLHRHNTFGGIDQLFYGYLLRNFRTLERRNAPLPNNVATEQTLTLSYQNPVISMFGYVLYAKSQTKNNLLYDTRLNANGTTESFALASANTTHSDMLMANVGKYFLALKTSINLDYELTLSDNPQLLNGIKVAIKTKNSVYGWRLSGKISHWLDWEYRYKKMSFENTINERSNAPSSQQTHQLNAGVYPSKNFYLGFKNEFYVNRLTEQSSQAIFSDVVVRYTLPKHRIDFETVCNNLWNTDRLVTASVNSFYYVESTYQLRPLQIIQRVRFSF